MVTHEDKLVNGASSLSVVRTKYADDLRFENLRSLIDNGHLEVFQSKEVGFAHDGSCRTNENADTVNGLPDGVTV